MSASARAFVCECGHARCAAQPRLTEAEYADLRRRGLKLVAAAHELPEATVVDRGPGWVAVGRRRRTHCLPAIEPGEPLAPARCPVCETETIPSPTGRCLWCGSRLQERAA